VIIISLICKLTWKNKNKSVATISVREIKGEIPWKNGEILIGRFDEERGILIMRREEDMN
jgi:hypothetical protein